MLSVLIHVYFYSHYVHIILHVFAQRRRSRSSHLRCSIKKLCLFRDLRANEYDGILRSWLKADETKSKKRKFYHNYNGKFFTYTCLIFLSPTFLFFDKFVFDLQWPCVTFCIEFTTSLSPMNPFLWQPLPWGRGLASSETELKFILKLILNSSFSWRTLLKTRKCGWNQFFVLH